MNDGPKQVNDEALDEVQGGAQYNPKEIGVDKAVPWKQTPPAKPIGTQSGGQDGSGGG